MTPSDTRPIQRLPVEQAFSAELERLGAVDRGARPAGWRLSPRMVRAFVLGDASLGITRKFHGDDPLVERCIVTLMSNRGLLLVGEPGTAKTMLSELLSAAISGRSTCTLQGTAGTPTDQMLYGWNYALLLAEGPSPRALVRGPIHTAMELGTICRIEEITRVQPEIQDCLIGILSDRVLHVPELEGTPSNVFAATGFNVLATANLRDRGVHELSSALKRRFHFETVRPLQDKKLEMQLVKHQTDTLLASAGIDIALPPDVIDLLVTAFHDLRTGVTAEGTVVEKPTAVMSSAEAVAVGYAACLDAHWLGNGDVGGEHVVRQLVGTVLKDNQDDGKKLRHWFEVVVKSRAQRDPQWRRAFTVRREVDR